MARHYTNRDFFWQMPNALLTRYFQGRGLFGDLDFSAMKEGKPDELFAATTSLTPGGMKSQGMRRERGLSAHMRPGWPRSGKELLTGRIRLV